jgi:hypothetical protein
MLLHARRELGEMRHQGALSKVESFLQQVSLSADEPNKTLRRGQVFKSNGGGREIIVI